MTSYIIQLNGYLFYTGRLYTPVGNINRAKHYKTKQRAGLDAIRIFAKCRYITRTDIVKIS